MENNIHKVGKYGSEDTCRDERNSVICAKEIFQHLTLNEPINGWKYVLLEDGVSEMLYYKRDCVKLPEGFQPHKIVPDVPTILLCQDDNPYNFYVILSGEDKYQESGGNAIERSNKNHRAVFEEKMCYNTTINPYIIFCTGPSFFAKDRVTPNEYFEAKLRQMLPYTKEGRPYVWKRSDPHSSHKQKWNQIYLKYDRFTKEEKYDIMMEVAMQSVNYYKNLLNE